MSAALGRAERVALLGASGCGKTTLCRVLLGALPPGARVEGAIRRDAQRGVRMAYVPQEKAESLHPMLQIGTVLREGLAAQEVKYAVGTAGGMRI